MAVRPETNAIIARYDRRTVTYDPLAPWVYMTRQELERAYMRWLRTCAPVAPDQLRLLELGCGTGGNFLTWLRLGLAPANLAGNELQSSLATIARNTLPEAIRVTDGDALDLDPGSEAFHVVFQSLVFSSILDDEFQQALATRMWNLAQSGGGVLWYDFIYDNPANPDVRGVPLARVRQLFPGARLRHWRVTLAPPISRRVTRLHPACYTICNALPPLRTHVLCWLQKP